MFCYIGCFEPLCLSWGRRWQAFGRVFAWGASRFRDRFPDEHMSFGFFTPLGRSERGCLSTGHSTWSPISTFGFADRSTSELGDLENSRFVRVWRHEIFGHRPSDAHTERINDWNVRLHPARAHAMHAKLNVRRDVRQNDISTQFRLYLRQTLSRYVVLPFFFFFGFQP